MKPCSILRRPLSRREGSCVWGGKQRSLRKKGLRRDLFSTYLWILLPAGIKTSSQPFSKHLKNTYQFLFGNTAFPFTVLIAKQIFTQRLQWHMFNKVEMSSCLWGPGFDTHEQWVGVPLATRSGWYATLEKSLLFNLRISNSPVSVQLFWIKMKSPCDGYCVMPVAR